MVLKSIALFLILACGAQALSLEQSELNDVGTRALQFGPQIEDAIRGAIGEIETPVKVTLPPELEKISLTALAEWLAKQGVNIPIKGELTLGNAVIAGIENIAPSANVTLNGIVQPIILQVLLSTPNIGLEADYTIEASLMGFIPVRGTGRMALGVGIGLGIDSTFKTKLGTSLGNFPQFDYIFDLQGFVANFEGLLGGEELSKEINKILNELLNVTIGDLIRKLEKTVHSILAGVIKTVLNDIKDIQDLTYAKLLELLQPRGGGLLDLALAINSALFTALVSGMADAFIA